MIKFLIFYSQEPAPHDLSFQSKHSEVTSESHCHPFGKTKAETLSTHVNQPNSSKTVDLMKSQSQVQLELASQDEYNSIALLNQDALKSNQNTLKFHHNQENVKQLAKVRLKSSDCSSECHDSLLRMDTLPNVSPESGISSLDESPLGNESPDFSNSGETCDQHSSTSEAAHGKTNETIHPAEHSDQIMLQCTTSSEEKSSACSSGNRPSTSLSSDMSVQEMSLPQVAHSLNEEGTVVDILQDNVQPPFSPHTHGSSVIVSSPQKITQASGRKKRGRPPKTMKCHFLKHKKSTLYNSAPEVCASTEGEGKSDNQAPSNGSLCVTNNSNVCDMVLPSHRGKIINSSKIVGNKKLADPSRATLSVLCQQKQPGQVRNTNDTVTGEKRKIDFGSKKRPRGRPRKIPNLTLTDGSLCSSTSGTNPASAALKAGKRKCSKRKLMFTRMKRKHHQKNLSPSVDGSNPQNLGFEGKETDGGVNNRNRLRDWVQLDSNKISQGSIFQDNDLDALLLSVRSSIKNQFKEDVSSDTIPNLTFDNPFALMQPPPFPKVARPPSPRIVKPKAKRPKLHVMMRQTKRRKKKFVGNRVTPVVEQSVPTPPILDVFSPVVAQERIEKLSIPPFRKIGTFGSSMTKRPFFTSCVQPSKILASSRLNVFRLGTGVDESHRSVTPPDAEAADSFERRLKKRHKLLYRKSKHKNIIDPVFAADLDMLLEGLTGMTISENPSDNFIRVRPGEMPLPSIFRVIKIDVNRKIKERAFTPEPFMMDKPKILKSRKDSVSPSESLASSFRPISKLGRKKTGSEVLEQQKRQTPLNDPSDQRLPPKKRHRMVNAEAPQAESSPPASEGEPKHNPMKKKGKRQRKVSGQDDCKSGG